jgi:hypothetical protein
MFEYEEQSRILVCYSFAPWLRNMQALWQLRTLFNTGKRNSNGNFRVGGILLGSTLVGV